MNSETNEESRLGEAAAQASKAAEQAQKASDLADKASTEAREAADKVRQVVDNTGENSEAQDSEREFPADPQDSSGGGVDPPSSPSLPGDPSTTRPDY